MLTLQTLLSALPPDDILAIYGDPSTAITAPVSESAQNIERGGVFVARKGRSTDGHDFIPQAIERGAAVIVGEHDLTDVSVPYVRLRDPWAALGHMAAAYHGFPARKLAIIGVTGTDGKTTTSTLVHSILRESTGGKTGCITTVNADLGGATADTGLHVTTPTAPEVHAYLAQMIANGLTHAVLESTSHGLAQGRLNGVDFDVAVMTNLRHEHLDFHGTFENYRAAKGRLFEMLDASSRKTDADGAIIPKISVINADDPHVDYYAGIPADSVIRYGLQGGNLRAIDIRHEADATRFTVDLDGETHEFALRLVGAFNVYNALAAIGATRALGADVDAIRRGLWNVAGIPGRMERIDEGQDFIAVVDFAHTPNALDNALDAARTLIAPDKRVIAVFGSAGLRDVEKRRLMAEISARKADLTVLTAEDPRTESLDDILAIMATAAESQGGIEGQTFIRVPDRGFAIYRACQLANPGDIVLALGKGHEQSMCFGTVEHPWDDRDALRAALRGDPLKTLPTAQ